MAIGLSFPFARASGSLGILQPTETELDAAAVNLKSLILTNWGERVNHYSMGVDLVRLLFEPRTQSLKERIADRIESQVQRWLPFLVIDVINVTFPAETDSLRENQVRIHVKFRMTSRPSFSNSIDLVVSH